MKNLHASILAAVFLFLGACTANSAQRLPLPAQDVTVTSPNLARIYIVREDVTGLRRSSLRVLDGSKDVGDLTPSTFLCWERPGGRTVGRVFYDAAVDKTLGKVEGVVDFDCPAGSAYYFKVVVEREGGKPEVTLLDSKEGKALVAERKWAGKP